MLPLIAHYMAGCRAQAELVPSVHQMVTATTPERHADDESADRGALLQIGREIGRTRLDRPVYSRIKRSRFKYGGIERAVDSRLQA